MSTTVPSPGFHIRAASPSEAEVIARFNQAMALETENLSLDGATLMAGVRRVFEDDALGRYYIAENSRAENSSKISACLLITYEWSDWRNGLMWWIQSVYVAPEYRRQGLFSALYAHVQMAARNAGARGLRLYVEHQNASAMATYERLGMEQTHYRLYEQML